MIAQELELTLHRTFVEAREQRHEFITVEHLLLSLLDNPTASDAMRACGANMEELRKTLKQHISEHTPRVADDGEVDTQPTLGFQRVLQRAILHAQSSGKKEVTGANSLIAIFGEKDSHAVYFLKQQGIARLAVLKYVSHGITQAPEAPGEDQEAEAEDPFHEGLVQILLQKDDQTPVGFAINVLQDFLLMPPEEATETVQEASRDGKAVCGLYPRETAEFIVQQVLAYARKHGHSIRLVTVVQK